MFGYVAIVVALLATVGAAYFYRRTVVSHNQDNLEAEYKNSRIALALYWAAALSVGASALFLLYIILTNQFDYAYVYGHSSRDLSLAYKLSAFWAGQEGSFLLWLLFHVLFGLFLAHKSGSGTRVMYVYCLLQSILMIFPLIKSPFMMILEPAADGVGLNPLLQDPWMVIHPPLVFIGYAALAVPIAYAVEGMFTKLHQAWVEYALPWALFAWSMLGAGIFIGGFWAYKVLGWGGYWAWDPVENSSLVPWLITGALIHLMLLVKVRPAAAGYTYLTTAFAYISVLYATFLTRSGVLSDFSTHSFADEGMSGILAGIFIITTAAALVTISSKWSSLPKGDLFSAIKSREFHLTAAAGVFNVFAAVVFIGMSTPLFTSLAGNPQNISSTFYNAMALPIATAMAILLMTGAVITWGISPEQNLSRHAWIIVPGVLGVGVALYFALRNPVVVLTVGLSGMALTLSVYAIAKKQLSWPAGFTHAGVTVMIAGILVSSAGGKVDMFTFIAGQPQQVFGNEVTYLGTEVTKDKIYQNFRFGPNGSNIQAITKLNKEGKDAAREPGIVKGLLGDVYFAPRHEHNHQEIDLQKGEKTAVEGLEIHFIAFGMNRMEDSRDISVFARLGVSSGTERMEIRPELVSRSGEISPIPVQVFNKYEVKLIGVNPGDRRIALSIEKLPAADEAQTLKVDVSHKPLINLVWLGSVLVTIGTGWAGWQYMVRKRTDAKHVSDKASIS